ncbi:coiled-coil domain-containing protein 147 [Fopius arisanus]|uniref:CCDC147 protein n=1 Tax=Fopius arisanus TaxID=64838 RepID=A0A0C9QU87_9HYME|nr:PREDICTED: coiled-coil domain-containing protein 147-like [Fopius arisanus]
MDMEMNAEDRDDGSDNGEPSAAGSSAGSAFCVLERDYARITEEMKANEVLKEYADEYTRLFEMLYKCRRDEEEMMEKFRQLQDEVIEKTSRIYELERTIEGQAEVVVKLKEEIVVSSKLADAAHSREQNAQEIIENSRLTIVKLNQEIEQRNKQLALDEDSAVTKQKESLVKEKERLTNEVETLKQRIKSMSKYTEELEKKTIDCDQQVNKMQENMDIQMNEISKERIIRERLEKELVILEEQVKDKNTQLTTANGTIKTMANNVGKLDNSLKEQKNSNEKLRKEVSKLMVARMNIQTEADNAHRKIEEMEKLINEKTKTYKLLEHEIKRLKEEMAKCKAESNWAANKYLKIDIARSKVEKEAQTQRLALKNTQIEVDSLKRQLADEKKAIEAVIRERDATARVLRNLKETLRRMQQVIDVCEQSKRKIESELEEAMQILNVSNRRIQSLETEREKFCQEMKQLSQQADHYANQLKLKDMELMESKSQLNELESHFRQQQNLFEAVRSERNTYSKNLTIAKDEISELRDKIKLMNGQIEQLKEDLATRETNLAKAEFMLSKAEKEKETARHELQSVRKDLFDLRREMEERIKEEKRLRNSVKMADMDINRLRKEIDAVMNERNVLGTQLVRRNDELSLQYSKQKILHGTISRGETEYVRRMEDIKLLRSEVTKLKTEKHILSKNLNNISDLRVEIFHLDRDLTRERRKVVALEEQVQNPLNIHRWRKLEAFDPSTLELLKKVQILQKRILKLSTELIEKDVKIKETEKLYIDLRGLLSKQPEPEIVENFEKARNALRERSKKMKCVVAELNMWETRANEYKYELENAMKDLRDLKIKYYTLKRKEVQWREPTTLKDTCNSSLPSLSPTQKRFCGGGFTMTVSPTRNCYSLESIAK